MLKAAIATVFVACVIGAVMLALGFVSGVFYVMLWFAHTVERLWGWWRFARWVERGDFH